MRYLLAAMAAGLLFLTAGSARAQTYDPAQLVQTWYERYLGREPDPGGLDLWAQQLQQLGPTQAQAGILASDEYYLRHGGTPEGFVEGLYADVLSRTASPGEIGNWINRLMVDNGDRAQVAREFLDAARPELGQAPVYRPARVLYGSYGRPYGYYGPVRRWDRFGGSS